MNLQSIIPATILKSRFAVVFLLLAGFCAAIGLRISAGRPDVSHSVFAGLLFAGCLAVLSVFSGTPVIFNKRILRIGLCGGIFLCLPAVLLHVSNVGGHTPGGNYLAWSIIVATVAFAEEAFLRGAMYERLTGLGGQKIAIFITAALFAALHAPLYGMHSVPLDFAVGLWLGTLRYQSGTFVAPGIAHVVADVAAWWII